MMTNKSQEFKLKDEFLLTEYSAVSSYFNQVINFRFVTFGFFITVVGFIFSNKPNSGDGTFSGCIIIALTVIVWLLELRNRSLSKTLTGRGMEIELLIDEDIENNIIMTMKEENPSDDDLKILRFFHRMEKGEKSGGEARLFGHKIGNIEISYNNDNKNAAPYKLYLISHSFLFDLAYSLTIWFSIKLFFLN